MEEQISPTTESVHSPEIEGPQTDSHTSSVASIAAAPAMSDRTSRCSREPRRYKAKMDKYCPSRESWPDQNAGPSRSGGSTSTADGKSKAEKPSRVTLDAVNKGGLCYDYHLGGNCRFDDCIYKHDESATGKILEAVQYLTGTFAASRLG